MHIYLKHLEKINVEVFQVSKSEFVLFGSFDLNPHQQNHLDIPKTISTSMYNLLS